LWDLITLEGCFEGSEKWDLAWHETAWGPQLEAFSLEQADEVGSLLFGRVTYDGMAAHWSKAKGAIADFMNGVDKVVFSSTLAEPRWENTRLVRSGAVDEVRRLKGEGGDGDLFVFGSADLSSSLLDAGVVDELRLGLVPVVLGNGTPFFKRRQPPFDLEHIETRQLGSRCTLLRYRPVAG
ncbi:MAG: dihydrofolate reductase family protein, partial [Gemmatimonadota bacterium]